MADAPNDPRTQRAPRKAPLSYRQAGVDIDAGAEVVRRIGRLVERVRRPEQLDALGGFAGLFALPPGLEDPVLAACTDGVGTKLAVAQAAGRHDTVGIDLVAMCVNDLVVTGAEPLFLLDYVATGRVDPDVLESIVAGIVEGCAQAGCALLGGETAEHPGTMAPSDYDLSACAVGVVERKRILGPDRVREGDAIVGLWSSGIHANGFSLVRKALLSAEHAGLDLHDVPPGFDRPLADVLLEPTRIYVRPVLAVRDLPGAPLHAAAHVTGGGIVENLPRVLPGHLSAHVDLTAIPRPRIFDLVAAQGVPADEMARTFNLGLGMALFVDADAVDDVLACLRDGGADAGIVGRVRPRGTDGRAIVVSS
ncbi:MAG: phosphoribosylformylglycinamidine cyclo-ligase [Deltaproteobacteria bacterium]|nr:MAG: phosphoribosylformylglycinamidine cyclo-ligase [Deltaproteobacteria bacterium]